VSVVHIDRKKLNSLIAKYGISVPRYTSYPTAPEWKHNFSQTTYEEAIIASNKTAKDYSFYLHIPFCESQCYFCGCNVVISPNHGIEKKYLEALKQELSHYGQSIHPERQIVQMAWGGGTPTYLSPEQILDLVDHISKNYNLLDTNKLLKEKEYSVEVDPRVTSKEHLEALWQAGFNRLSLGVQDFNPQTQEAINRIQPFSSVAKLFDEARAIGFKSINFDLIYGLPYQTLETFLETIKQVKELNPDRIAFFNYAHLPSMFPFQKKYIDDASLPSQEEKLKIFDTAVESFTEFGYQFIGLDHFAKPNDSLAIALQQRSLYRNFQGYTTYAGCDLFGFGVSAISDVQGVYKQNAKTINDYYQDFKSADKFFICNQDDIERREIIKQIMCNGFVELDSEAYAYELTCLEGFVQDQLLEIKSSTAKNKVTIEVLDLGKFFLRNIAAIFDNYLQREQGFKAFSKAL